MADCQALSDAMMELETPKKLLSPEPSTPRRSERKRALFPSASPQTSDLGHMSPLGSSPDRYSSAPASPDSLTFSPAKKLSLPVSPFGRKVSAVKALSRESPRKQFSLLFAQKSKFKTESSSGQKITPLTPRVDVGHSQPLKTLDNLSEIVPVDQLEQTVLSVMSESDCPESPDHTPGTTPHNKEMFRARSDVSPSQPLTPSKRRSMPASCSGSTTSTSPHSPERKRRVSLESRSRSAGAELPKARTSLFSIGNRSSGAKRPRDDGVYLTGRNIKRRKVYGEINAGVKTGIRRPPKVKAKVSSSSAKKQGKIKSIWDVGPKSTTKKKSLSPIKIPKMSLLAKQVKLSDEEIASQSASASLQVRSKRNLPQEEVEESEESEPDVEPDPSKRFFKRGKPRSATITLSKNIKIKVHKGKFTVDKSTPAPPAKRRRQLYNQDKHIQAINSFDDSEEDVAASTRSEVQNILEKLAEDKSTSPESLPAVAVPHNPVNEISTIEEPLVASAPRKADSPVSSSPVRVPESLESLMSPLSQLASSTSTLSINVGGDTLRLTEAQVKALTAVPDVVMEDDDLPLCEPLPEETSEINEAKENVISSATENESTPVKYFPIFSSNFSHQKVPLSPTLAKRKRSLLRAIGNDQYQLDAGQKRFGATECGTCSAIYQMGEPEDELAHKEFHDAVKDLRFMGWKNENVVGEYGRNRVIVIRPGDPKVWWNKAMEILNVVDKDLGFAEGVTCDPNHSMVYLYISDKSVVGCLLAIPLKKANKMVPTAAETEGIDCCTAEEYAVKCGVSRIWVHRPHRRNNIASNLMDCMRKNFIFGHVLSLAEIAFSSPTTLGKSFAEHYTGCKDYYVYTSTS